MPCRRFKQLPPASSAPRGLYWRPFTAGSTWHCFARYGTTRYRSLCSQLNLPRVGTPARLAPPAQLRCAACQAAALERRGAAFARTVSPAWEDGWDTRCPVPILIHEAGAAATIVELLRSRGLAPSPYLLEKLAEYGYRIEPAGDAGAE
ncbi:MAG TPA: hypothetical protein VN999_05115 [Thermoanaerobaculia bacterium]|nr:hypothetical protein [Thermoanaerobaculia bacterium]